MRTCGVKMIVIYPVYLMSTCVSNMRSRIIYISIVYIIHMIETIKNTIILFQNITATHANMALLYKQISQALVSSSSSGSVSNISVHVATGCSDSSSCTTLRVHSTSGALESVSVCVTVEAERRAGKDGGRGERKEGGGEAKGREEHLL